MKTKFIIGLGALLFPLLLLAQAETSKPKAFLIIKSPSFSKEILSKNILLYSSDIATIEFITTIEAEKRFGKLPENAVIAKIMLMPGVKISTLSQFLKTHGVNENKRKLPFVIDGETRTDTTNLLIVESSLNVINIKTDSIEIMTAGYLQQMKNRKNIKYK